jgi:hypothetical protein
MAYWLFQGNPKYYRIMNGIRDFEQMLWSVTPKAFNKQTAFDMIPAQKNQQRREPLNRWKAK